MNAKNQPGVSGWFYLGLLLGALCLVAGTSALQQAPGYMDAEYYYAGGLRLVAGQGWTEPYLWNYLSAPGSLPAPAFTYWMPLASLLAALGLKVGPGMGFWGARLPFILLAASVPPLTTRLAWGLTGQVWQARLAGVFALFPGFYLAYLGLPESFALYMGLGCLFWLVVGHQPGKSPYQWAFLGLLSGLMHLARADGILYLAATLGIGLWWVLREQDKATIHWRILTRSVLVIAGYLLVMGPWYLRNLTVWGGLFPPGGSRTLWLVEYGQTMIYPASLLTPQAWLAAGWGTILTARFDALATNLQTTLAVQGGVVLLPLMLIGAYQLRHRVVVVGAAGVWLATLGVMSLVFPYAGVNGGFFHAGAAVQPVMWALAPMGLVTVVDWAARLRRWQRGEQVLRFMSIVLVGTGALLSLSLYFSRVVGSEADLNRSETWTWHQSNVHYHEVEFELGRLGAQPGQSVLVNNPPGYFLASGREAVVIPFGDVEMLLRAAKDYQIDYVVLEETNPPMLADLYYLRKVPPELEYLGKVGATQLFLIRSSDGGD